MNEKSKQIVNSKKNRSQGELPDVNKNEENNFDLWPVQIDKKYF